MGAFDHLIPQDAQKGGMFDHLIPATPTNEDPGLSAMGYPSNPNNQTARIATAIPQGTNSYLADLVNAPMDYSGKLMQWLGAVPKGTPLPSEMIQNAGRDMRSRLGVDYTPNITPETPEEKTALDIGRTVGAVGTTVLPAMGALKAMGPATAATAPSVGRGIAETLASQPGLQLAGNVAGDVVTHATDNPWLGMGASLALPFGANAVNRIEHAAPALTGSEAARRSLLQDSQKAGVLPTFGTITDSYPIKMAESVLSKLPFGDAVGNINKNNQTNLTKAFLDKIPNVAGEGIDAFPKATSENIGARIGRQFNALESGTTVNIDNQVGADIAKAKADFSKNLEANMSPRVVKQLDELATAPAAGSQAKPQIDGETYKNIRSDLSKMLTSTSGTDREAVGAMINALDGAVERSLPKDMVQEWKDARTSWRRYMMLKDATDARHNTNTDIGIIPPGAVAARAGNDKEMNRLAEIGTSFVGDKMPDSGTGLRNFFMQLPGLVGAGAGGAINPIATAATMGGGYGANALLNNPYMRRAMINRYAKPTESLAPAGMLGNMTLQQLLAR